MTVREYCSTAEGSRFRSHSFYTKTHKIVLRFDKGTLTISKRSSPQAGDWQVVTHKEGINA